MVRRSLLLVLVLATVSLGAFAQTPTGTLSGHATDGTTPLPGVTVTVTSPSMQGARTSVTGANGDYILAFLPPGDYHVKFDLQGFQTIDTTVKVNAAQTQRLDATMPQTKVAEEVTVTGSYETISRTGTASTTLEASFQNKLPVARDLQNAVLLSPMASNTGPSNAIAIAGAQSYENLFMVNGVEVNENLRGQATNLFIEDAIQETTTTSSGVSAEYGRFAGGVVNTLTKSGGNELHGTFRTSFDNSKWTATTPKTVPYSRLDKVNETYEATLGGYFWQDKLWYFVAGRNRKTAGSSQTQDTLIAYPTGLSEKRYEGKLTLAPTPEHRFVGSYINRDRAWTNFTEIGPIVDTASLDNRGIPESLMAVNYTGVLSDSFFVEGQYSQRKLEFQNAGGRATPPGDLITGTVLYSNSQGYLGNVAYFCGSCTPNETRDNKDYFAKGSWFLSTAGAGSHNIIVGYDQFHDKHFSINHQSPSDYVFSATTFAIGGKNWYPVVYGDGSADMDWYPFPVIGAGTDFAQTGTFINDKWRLNNNWSFNVGVRYDKNNGKNSIGGTVAKDSTFSPRLGVVLDPKGDGDWIINANYGKYVMTIAGTSNVADQSPQAGAQLYWGYYGPEFNTNCDPVTGTNCTSPQDVLRGVFAWFDSIGGTHSVPDYGTVFNGYNRVIKGSLDSPYAQEIAAGVTKRIGNAGLLRVDYIHRDFKNAYETVVNQGTGQVDVVALGQDWGQQDLGYVQNSSFLKRKYDGLSLQGNFRLHDVWTVGGNYTYSEVKGNFDGETSDAGPVTASNVPGYYPEFQEVKWSNPTGDLNTDQRNRGRVWVVYDAVNTKHNSLSVSLLQSYFSGTPYGAVDIVKSYRYVSPDIMAKYVNPPLAGVTYYYSARDAYRTDNITRTDLSVNYGFKVPALGKDIEIFVIPALTNVFNEHGVTAPNATVLDRARGYSQFAYFNPFTTTPVECPQGDKAADCTAMGANWQKGANFGKPTSPAAYQTPRTFSLSVGVRF